MWFWYITFNMILTQLGETFSFKGSCFCGKMIEEVYEHEKSVKCTIPEKLLEKGFRKAFFLTI